MAKRHFGFGETSDGIVRRYFFKKFPRIAAKVARQVERTPRRLTGPFKTNREHRWLLDAKHPDYTAKKQIPLIEGKLFAMALCFADAPGDLPADIREAASAILGKQIQAGSYECPVSGVKMNFQLLRQEAAKPIHGRSSFHVGHVRPRAKGGENKTDNTYWTSDLGNRIQGDKSWHDTVKTIIEMAEYHRKGHGDIPWGELVNRYFQ